MKSVHVAVLSFSDKLLHVRDIVHEILERERERATD
jgi:hypothetical protein